MPGEDDDVVTVGGSSQGANPTCPMCNKALLAMKDPVECAPAPALPRCGTSPTLPRFPARAFLAISSLATF